MTQERRKKRITASSLKTVAQHVLSPKTMRRGIALEVRSKKKREKTHISEAPPTKKNIHPQTRVAK